LEFSVHINKAGPQKKLWQWFTIHGKSTAAITHWPTAHGRKCNSSSKGELLRKQKYKVKRASQEKKDQ
jgi:hypothetical protein